MTSSLQQLDQTLTGAIRGDQSLALTGTLIGSQALGTLIARLAPSGTLTIQKAVVTPAPDGSKLTVTGQADSGKLTGAPITVTFTADGSGVLQMTARIDLPDGTGLKEIFAVLGDRTLSAVTLDGGAMILSSQTYSDPGTGRHFDPGLNLTGTVEPVAILPYLGAILPSTTRLALAGPVQDIALPLFDLTTVEAAGTLAGVSLSALSLEFASTDIASPANTPTALGQAILHASLEVGGVTGTVSAPLPPGGASLALSARFTGLTLTSFTDLAAFIGNVNPFTALPKPIEDQIHAVTDSFALTTMGLSVDLSKPAFNAVSLGVTVNLNGYKIFDPIPALSVNALDLTLKVKTSTSPAVVTFGASATIAIHDYSVLLGFQTQSTGGYQISVAQAPGKVLKLSDILKTFMPGLTDFPEFEVESFGLLLLPEAGNYSFDAVIKSGWQVLSSPSIRLTEVDVSALYDTKVTPTTSGRITGILTLAVSSNPDDQILITLSAVKPKGVEGWELTGQTGSGQVIPIGNLISAVVGAFDTAATTPEFLSGLQVENLDLMFDTAQKAFHFGTEILMPFSDEIVLTLTVSLDIEPLTQESGYATTFRGTIQIAELRFDIVFDDKTAQSDTLIATYQPLGSSRQSVTLRKLLAGISESLAEDVPLDIEIDLKDVKFVFHKDKTTNRMAFGLDVGIPIDLSDIPIVGNKLPADLTLAITNLQGVYATGASSESEMSGVNGLLPTGVVPFPKEGLGQGVNIAAELRIGDWTERFQLGGMPPSTYTSPALRGGAVLAGAAVAATPSTTVHEPNATAGEDSYKWINVNKQIGIFQFNRIGAGYANNLLSLALDAGVTLGPLSFSMLGLSVGTPMGKFAPEFGLNGLGLTFNQPPIDLSGGFLKIKDKTGSSYFGQVVVQVAQIGFSALGGWSPDANPASFFLYANVDIPMGGPPYLQLKALAGGIGINRSLILPTIEELPGYVLLPKNAPPAPATPQGTIATVLPELEKHFINKPGEYWIAAGIAFSSFEMIEAFALVTVSFGVDFELGILGSLSMTIPTEGEEPIAYVEANLVASFAPSNGFLSLEGVLSPRSFVFGRFVKIEGGFAFCLWFSRENAGDFVGTVGGYYPSFDKPAHYPTVPRLKMGFTLGPVGVSGTAYFALTPAMLMAGMSMNAVFNGGPIKAWFNAAIDLLIAWSPFRYQAGCYVSIGVSADLGLFTLKVQVGADLLIWGPSFGGKAHVDLDVASFSFTFGAKPSGPQPVGWSGFSQSFLPPASPAPQAKAPATTTLLTPMPEAAASIPGLTNIIKVTTKTGLVSTSVPGYDAIISPNGFEIEITSTIPSNTLNWTQSNGKEAPLANDITDWSTRTPVAGSPFLTLPEGTETFGDTEVWNPNLDIAPMGKKGVTSRLTVGVLKHTDRDGPGEYSDPTTDFSVAPILASSNTALWKSQDVSSDPNVPALLGQTLVGIALSPVPLTPDKVSDVPLIELFFTRGNATAFFPAKADVVPDYGVSAQIDATEALTITLTGNHRATLPNTDYHLDALVDPWVSGQRAAVADALSAAGFGTYPAGEIDLTTMATRKAMTDWPMIRQLGA